ncbi:helix-turn-helix transcriptional regulator [Cognatishimia activa]|uniref:AlpA family phage regulatory protein n=1 Tax=Cognatishimia activa TaxID=1715691 RepID=A0A975I6C5_9RHOB|nr:AlpA family phage regulatory protein [Cognatishimia activa]
MTMKPVETTGNIYMVYLSSNQVQERYQISRSSLYRWQDEPSIGFPRPVKVGHRILWRDSDLDAFDARLAGASLTNSQGEPAE